MKKKILDLVEHILVAVGIGAIVSTVCMFVLQPEPVAHDVLKQTSAWLVASALFGILSKIYDCEALPLPAAIGIHMGGCLTITLATCWLLGYAELGGNFFFAILPVFLVIYGVISGLVFWADHKSAEEVNQNLK